MNRRIKLIVILIVLIVVLALVFGRKSAKEEYVMLSYVKSSYADYYVGKTGIYITNLGNVYTYDDLGSLSNNNQDISSLIKEKQPVGKIDSSDLKRINSEVKKIANKVVTKNLMQGNGTDSTTRECEEIVYYDSTGNTKIEVLYSDNDLIRKNTSVDNQYVKDLLSKYYADFIK